LKQLLVLFDVDGTLFLTHDPLAGRALRETLEQRYQVELRPDAEEHVDHRGQTALRIARLVLEAAGLQANAIDEGLDEWCHRFAERYLELLAEVDPAGWQPAPGAEQALSRLAAAGQRLALLTGNPEPVARARMERLGLARFFPGGQGAFGCDCESRTELIELARVHAGWSKEATVAVGDTRRDLEGSHAGGIRFIALAPDQTGFEQAEAVCADLEEVASTLLAWAG
jgi:phosphoglycolate phosphatase-like HAD superfamily hydrolase